MSTDGRVARLERLRASLVSEGLDALIVTHIANIRYLTGFTGTSAMLFVEGGDAVLYTDRRYEVQAQEEVAGAAAVEIVAGDPWKAVRRRLEGASTTDRIGFEAHAVTCAETQGENARFAQLSPTTSLVENLRSSKDDDERNAIAAAGRVTSDALEAVLTDIRPGLREIDVAAALERELRLRGSEWHPFPTIVASGRRSALPHARTTQRVIEPGDLLLLDFGAQVEGYCADVTRTVVVGGRADERQREVYELVREAQGQAISGIRAGMTGREADHQARSIIEDKGFGDAFAHSLGHGLGLEVHEAPRVSQTNTDPIPLGCVITVEPGIYLPDWGGVRIEDDVVVTEDGTELLTDGETELVELV